jgi:hypothetical protein
MSRSETHHAHKWQAHLFNRIESFLSWRHTCGVREARLSLAVSHRGEEASHMETLTQDVRYGLRMPPKRPTFADVDRDLAACLETGNT